MYLQFGCDHEIRYNLSMTGSSASMSGAATTFSHIHSWPRSGQMSLTMQSTPFPNGTDCTLMVDTYDHDKWSYIMQSAGMFVCIPALEMIAVCVSLYYRRRKKASALRNVTPKCRPKLM